MKRIFSLILLFSMLLSLSCVTFAEDDRLPEVDIGESTPDVNNNNSGDVSDLSGNNNKDTENKNTNDQVPEVEINSDENDEKNSGSSNSYGDNKQDDEFHVRLPEVEISENPNNIIEFSDVKDTSWYAVDVAKATELGLINGYDGKFYPDNYLTYSETIKLAACMHQLKTTGKVTLVIGTKNWYDTYVEYAKQNKIISKDYDWTANATRAGYVEIFAHALPDDALSAKNTVADGAIPDVAMSDYAAKEIYKLYRAGILTGSDAKGTFNPDSNILRCEVAAILTRMMDESARKIINLG